MNVLGSFFLGDAHHMRLISSTSSPPGSPTPSLSLHGQQQQYPGIGMGAAINPELSLELRVRWLEALVNGVKSDKKNPDARAHNEQVDADTKRGREWLNPEGIGERG